MRSDLDAFDLEPAGRGREGSNGLGLALLALAIGAGSAMLFAPVEGARTRQLVQGRLRDLRGGAEAALELYRTGYQPSAEHPRPYAMLGLSVVAADSDAEARRLATSLEQQFLALPRGRPVQLQPPVDSMDGRGEEWEESAVRRTLRQAVIGGPDTVQRGLEAFIAQTNADELMITSHIYDHAARLRSYEIVAEVRDLSDGRMGG